MANNSRSGAIRLTNKTARNLRQQAKQQRNALYIAATVLSILLSAAAVLLGMQHLVFVPLTVLLLLALDALILLAARGRYLSLTAQAICTEAAARQLQGESAEERRITTAMRDLARIKADLAMDADDEADEDEDDEDEDMYRPARLRVAAPPAAPTNMPTQPVRIHKAEEKPDAAMQEAPARRRRQARLQVLVSDTPDNRAN